jgi:hypothetical protein
MPSVFSFECDYFSGIDRDNCIALNSSNEGMIANLIYTNHSYPDFQRLDQYNSQIIITAPPDDVSIYSQEYIVDTWVSIIDITPLIIFENYSYTPNQINVWSEYYYDVQIPEDYHNNNKNEGQTCKISYSKDSDTHTLNIYSNDLLVGNSKRADFSVDEDSIIKATLDVAVVIKADFYEWNKYHIDDYVYYKCEYENTQYYSESLSIQDNQEIRLYSKNLVADAIITGQYHNTTRGQITKDNNTSITLNIGHSLYIEQEFEYYARFKKSPYNILELEAVRQKNIKIDNLFISENKFYSYTSENCSITSYNFFNQTTKYCNQNITQDQAISSTPLTVDLTFLMMIAVLVFILFSIYKIIKHYWGRYILILIITIIIIPNVSALDCGLTNLASCIPQAIFDFIINILNSALQPLLTLLQNLLSNSPDISLFGSIWAIIIYCLSIFYSFLIMYAGLQLLFSGHNVIKREMAKEWLKNTIIMIVLIQASFYLYELILNISAIMTSGILSLADPTFFQLTADNIVNIGLQFIFTAIYVFVLVITIIYLAIRYLVVCIGIIFFPIGLFCYFVPPIKSYGKLILHLLGILIFVTVLDAIVILACAKLIDIQLFQNFKILVMITSLLIIDIITIILIKHIITKTGIEDNTTAISEAIKYIGMIG